MRGLSRACRSEGKWPLQRRLIFQRLQVRDHVADLPGIELKFRHRRMAGDDTFGKRFLERFDRIALMQRAEGRRDFERARSDAIYRVASRAVGAHEDKSPLRRGRKCFFASCGLWQQGGSGNNNRENGADAVLTARQLYLRHDYPVSQSVSCKICLARSLSIPPRPLMNGIPRRDRPQLSFVLGRGKCHAGMGSIQTK